MLLEGDVTHLFELSGSEEMGSSFLRRQAHRAHHLANKANKFSRKFSPLPIVPVPPMMGAPFLQRMARKSSNFARPLAHNALNLASKVPIASNYVSAARSASSLVDTGKGKGKGKPPGKPGDDLGLKMKHYWQGLPKAAKYGAAGLGVLIVGGVIYKIVK